LRIEDIDSPRIKPGAADEACEDLRWLGLDWDDGPIYQTSRLRSYESALETLKAAEAVYPCTCSRLDVEHAASAPHAEHEGPVYPGTCAHRRVADAATLTAPYSWRFRANMAEEAFFDGFRGETRMSLKDAGGDFVVWKSAGTPAYQLAVVVDDAHHGVTEVVRGDDLVTSTPRQLHLYRALGLRAPAFWHVPLVVGPDGRRLAKRHGDTRLSAPRRARVSAESVVGLLAWSCGWIDRIVPIHARELFGLFRWESIPTSPLVLTPDLLREIGFYG
jgi:glutamyl-tRNA synthetase